MLEAILQVTVITVVLLLLVGLTAKLVLGP